jgi:2-haloalkanoic acid dehalogenase type II
MSTRVVFREVAPLFVSCSTHDQYKRIDSDYSQGWLPVRARHRQNRSANFSERIVQCNERSFSAAPQQREQLLAGFMNMKAWPDVVPVLKDLKSRGLGLAPLTDFSISMLEAGIKNSDLGGTFDHLLSTDLVKAYKPDPRSYQMGIDAFGLQRPEIAFIAFGGWDAAGARTFGYPTIWVNRLNAPTEHLGVLPDKIASNFEALPDFVRS